MKKGLLVLLALAMILTGISITACGKGVNIGPGGGGTIHITDSEGGGDIVLEGGGKTPEDFGDIPIYPGCEQLYKLTGDEDMNGQPGVLDHRMYSSGDSTDKVVSFYKEKMPANGWTEDAWYESTLNMGTYSKGETSVAVISITPGDTTGTSVFTIDKKYQK